MTVVTGEVLYQLVYAGVFIGVIYGVVAVSLNLLYSTLKMFNIAAGDFLMIGSYLTFVLSTSYGLTPLLSIFLVMAMLCAVGVALNFTVFKRILSTSKNVDMIETVSVLLFFGFVQILDNSANLIWGGQFTSFKYSIPLPFISDGRVFTIVVGLIMISGLLLFMRYTWAGRSIKYVVQNTEAARIVGVSVRRAYLITTVLAFAFLGAAGTMVSMNYTLTPYVGVQYTMDGFVAMVLGGVGNPVFGLPAGIFIGLLETFGTYFSSPSYRIVISYVAFLIVLVVKRGKISGGRR